MNVENLVITIMIFSALVLGMGIFQGGLMDNYGEDGQADNITSLERSKTINDKMAEMRESIESFSLSDPLTWGNLVGLGINLFSILFELPGMIHGMAVDASTMVGLPAFFPYIVETIALVILVFGAYRALRGGQI